MKPIGRYLTAGGLEAEIVWTVPSALFPLQGHVLIPLKKGGYRKQDCQWTSLGRFKLLRTHKLDLAGPSLPVLRTSEAR